jgi:hypothetical protein
LYLKAFTMTRHQSNRKSHTSNAITNPICKLETPTAHSINKKNQSRSSIGKLPFSSLDHSHQATVTWLNSWIQAYTAGFERWFYYWNE